MKIESKKVSVNAPAQTVYDYVSNLNNFRELLPQDRIAEWESDTDWCSFKVQGTATISLKIKESTPPNSLVLENGQTTPFPITVHIHIRDVDGGSEAYQQVVAEVNPFMKMMVEKPLHNLFDFIADRLQEKFG